MFAKYADLIYTLNPDLCHVLPARAQFLPYAHVDLRQWQVVEKGCASAPPVVVHAPTHRGGKGTGYLLNALARLKDEGIPFEFKLVEGMTNRDARVVYESAGRCWSISWSRGGMVDWRWN